MEAESLYPRHGQHPQGNNNHGHYGRRGPAAVGSGGVSQRGGRSRAGPGRRTAPSGVMRFVDSMMSPFVQCFQPPIDPCTDMTMPACGTVCGSGVAPAVPPPRRAHTATSHVAATPAPVGMEDHRYGLHGGAAATTAMVTPVAASRRLVPSQQEQPIFSSPSQEYHSFVAQPPALQRLVLTDPTVKVPSEADVLCGRGGNSNRHNVHFRELVAANKAIYVTLTKKQKMMFSRQVVDTIHQAGGRFLAKDPSTGDWSDIGRSRSLEKASQALREKATNNGNNSSNTSVIISDEGVEATTEIEPPPTKPNPRTVQAPPLIVPQSLQHIYRPKQPTVVTPESFRQQQEWVADFPSAFPQQPSSYHPSDHRMHNMPAPHMGNVPFTSRQMSRLGNIKNRRQQQHRRVCTVPAIASTGPSSQPQPHHHPMAVTPTSMIPHPMSWQNSLNNDPAVYSTHGGSSDASVPVSAAFDTEYPSSATSCNSASSATLSPPDFHQFYPDFEPPPDASSRTTTTMATTAATTTHPHPLQEHPQEVKRQRTREEEKREGILNEESTALAGAHEEGNEKGEEKEEEEVILLDSDHQTTLNNSLQEGSEQLPKEVESKLCLHEKVICSPTDLLQGRGARRQRVHHHHHHHDQRFHDNSSSIMTSTTTSPIKKEKPANTSAEAADMAGLAALSAAAYLRLDEGE